MKFILLSGKMLAVVFFSLLLFSCGKDKPAADEYGIYFKFNGTQMNFPEFDRATHNELGNHTLTISAEKASVGPSITLVSDQNDFTTGKVYLVVVPSIGGKNIMEYYPVYNDYDNGWNSLPPDGQEAKLIVRITEATDAFVKGTFEAFLYQHNGATEKALVTDGRFYVRYPH